MTEEEWLRPVHPYKLLRFAEERFKPRKSLLFAAAWCRHVWAYIADDDFWKCVQFAEQMADNREDPHEVGAMWDRLGQGDRFMADWQAAMIGILDPATNTAATSALNYGKKPVGSGEAIYIADIFGNPFRPVTFDPGWRTSDVMALARGIYEERAFERMPILADALQDAGCENADILGHLRDPNATHVHGCWALDLVLGKEKE